MNGDVVVQESVSDEVKGMSMCLARWKLVGFSAMSRAPWLSERRVGGGMSHLSSESCCMRAITSLEHQIVPYTLPPL